MTTGDDSPRPAPGVLFFKYTVDMVILLVVLAYLATPLFRPEIQPVPEWMMASVIAFALGREVPSKLRSP